MNTHTDKTPQNKSQAIANSVPENQTFNNRPLLIEDKRPEAIAQRKMQETANATCQVKQLKAYQAMADNYTSQSYPVQRTIFSIGDDRRLAEKDGASLSKKLQQDYIEVPIPELKSPDALVTQASSPFVVMFHGSTLKRMGAYGFRNLLIEKGYPRSKGLELVLITCSADQILGEDAQMLSNVLQSNIRAAKGKVVVQPDGTPWVIIEKGGKTETYKEDIFHLMKTRFFEDFADGWSLYKPQPEATLTEIKIDAQTQKRRAKYLLEEMKPLMEVIEKAPKPAEITDLRKRIESLMQETDTRHQNAVNMKGKATNPEMLRYRKMLEDTDISISGIKAEIRQLEQAWKDHNGIDISSYLYNLKNPVKLADIGNTEEEAETTGWDDDIDLDALIEENAGGNNSTSETIQTKPVDINSNKVVQRAKFIPGNRLADGRTLNDLMNGFHDVDLVNGNNMDLRVQFGPTGEERWAITELIMDNKVQIPFEALTMENANKAFEIRITLSEKEFQGGLQQFPQLISTFTHEWELHGRQFAQNIQKIKTGQIPDSYFAHGHFFEPGVQGIDRAMAQGISNAKAEHKAEVLADYLKDANAHIEFVMKGWREGDNQQAVYFHRALKSMKESWKIIEKITPQGKAQTEYEKLITAFMPALEDSYFDNVEEDATVDGLSFFIENPGAFYSQLIAAYSTAIPGDEDNLYKVSRKDFKVDHIRQVLLYANGFRDAVNAVLNADSTPRVEAMKSLGH